MKTHTFNIVPPTLYLPPIYLEYLLVLVTSWGEKIMKISPLKKKNLRPTLIPRILFENSENLAVTPINLSILKSRKLHIYLLYITCRYIPYPFFQLLGFKLD
uniref:Uncharacterized protein n=1 Tax=Cacopsylla melanoneura TaxID=428564 RepID=A0A8D9FC29_9HEMI